MSGNIDRRAGSGDKFPVWRREIGTITMLAAGTTEVTLLEGLNGIIGTLIISLPDSTNGVTATISVRDEDGYVLYSAAALADNTDHVKTGVDILVAGNVTFGLTASGAPGGTSWIGTLAAYGV